MKFVIVAAAVILALLVLIWGRFAVKRISMAGKIKKACREYGCRIHARSPMWMFGYQSGEKCDFYVESEHYIYSVKLFGVLGKKNILVFSGVGQYFYRQAAGARQMSEPSDSWIRTLKSFDFRHNYRDEWEENPAVRALGKPGGV